MPLTRSATATATAKQGRKRKCGLLQENCDPQLCSAAAAAAAALVLTKARNPSHQPRQENHVVVDGKEEEPVEKILETMGKKYLVALVKEAVSNYPDLIQSIRKVADSDPAQRKIIVRRLGVSTTAETLNSVFREYGEIKECKVNNHRGTDVASAFIVFKHRNGARKALKNPNKQIGDHLAMCLPDSPFWSGCSYGTNQPRSSQGGNKDEEEEEPVEKLVEPCGKDYLVAIIKEAISKKPSFIWSVYKQADVDPAPRLVVVSGLYSIGYYTPAKIMTSVYETLISIFGKYGEILDCTGDVNRAFILFKHRNSAREALKEPDKLIGDYWTFCIRSDAANSTPSRVNMGWPLVMNRHPLPLPH